MQFHLKVLGWDFAEILNVANRILVAAVASLVWLALILAVVSPQRAFAQTTSTIVGTVSDPQGLLLPGATVKVTSETLGVVMETTSDPMGNYSIVGLPAGTYTLEASHSGFAARRFEKLELLLNRTLVMNVTLPVGTLQQNVTVTAEVPLLQTNERIKVVGPWVHVQAAAPRGIKVIDLSRATVTPGLIDCHAHLLLNQDIRLGLEDDLVLVAAGMSPSKRVLSGAARAREDVEAGFTTVRSIGNSGIDGDVALRDAINQGWVEGPRMLCAGRKITPPGGQGIPISNMAEAIIAQEYLPVSGPDEA